MYRQKIIDIYNKYDLSRTKTRDRFFVTDCNIDAVTWLEQWLHVGSEGRGLILLGESGSGKTHLANIWAREHGAHYFGYGDLSHGSDCGAHGNGQHPYTPGASQMKEYTPGKQHPDTFGKQHPYTPGASQMKEYIPGDSRVAEIKKNEKNLKKNEKKTKKNEKNIHRAWHTHPILVIEDLHRLAMPDGERGGMGTDLHQSTLRDGERGGMGAGNSEKHRNMYLMSILNDILAGRGRLLITTQSSPRDWSSKHLVDDIRSRLLALPIITINLPEANLIKDIICKELLERGIPVLESAVLWLSSRLPRSFAAAKQASHALIKYSLTNKKRINFSAVRRYYLEHCEDFGAS